MNEKISRRTHGQRLVKMRRVSIAASVVLFVLFAGWRYASREREDCQKMVTVEIAQIEPGSTQARLQLASGEEVYLRDQDTVVKTPFSDIRVIDGQVTYSTTKEMVSEEITYNTISVPRGGIYSLKLSDGTVVFMNSESELTYPVVFHGKTREVSLKGEAYFEVKRDSSRPFIVYAGEMSTEVLGTTFDIKAYPDEDVYSATLLSGKVRVSVESVRKEQVLSPGTRAVWKKGTDQIYLSKVDGEIQTLWRNGELVLNEDELEDVMRALCRWYDVRYEYRSELKEKYTFTGKIDRNESLNEVLGRLMLMGGPRFEIKDSVVYIE